MRPSRAQSTFGRVKLAPFVLAMGFTAGACSSSGEMGSFELGADEPSEDTQVIPSLASRERLPAAELDLDSVKLVREAVGRNYGSLGFDRASRLDELRPLRTKRLSPADVNGPVETIVTLQQTFENLPIIGGTLNAELLDGEVRDLHGDLLDRSEIERRLGSSVRSAHVTPAQAAHTVEQACGQNAKPVDPSREGPWIDADLDRPVFRLFCDGSIFHVDAETGAIAASGSAHTGWTPTFIPILTGRDGDRLSNAGSEWFPNDIGKPNDVLLRFNKVRGDRSPFAGTLCYWQMSMYYDDGEAAEPFPSLRPSNDYVRNALDYCSSPTAFADDSADKLKEQHAYDRIWLAAYATIYSTSMKLWAVFPPDEHQTLRINTWRTDSSGDHCGNKAASYLALYEDIDLCLDHENYETYLAPLHEYGHYIADSYGFMDGISLQPPCAELAAQEGVAASLAVMFEHQRYTGGGEQLNAANRSTLMANGPGGAAEPMAVRRDGNARAELQNVDAWCSNAYTIAQAMVQVMWKLLNNSLCQFDAAGACTSVTTIGPTSLPAWAREDFVRTLDVTDEDTTSVEKFLVSVYMRFFNTRRSSFTTQQWENLRLAFTQNGVDLPF
jgi:hypothetical protein